MCPHFLARVFDLPRDSRQLVACRIRPGHSTELFAASAVEYLKTRSPTDERPFFLYVAFTAPHDPRETHHRFRKRYNVPPPLPANFLPEHPFALSRSMARDEALAEFPRSTHEIRMHLGDYYALITHMDEGIGRIHAALEQRGLLEQTIVVHTADHGLAVGSQGLMGKQSLYDHSVRVPLTIAGPGFAAGATDDRLCYQHDLFPTLVAAAGVEAGSDWTHLRSARRRTDVTCGYADTMRSIRDERFKLIEYRVPDGRRTQLHDMVAYPDELRDLSESGAYHGTLTTLRNALAEQLTHSNDPQARTFAG
jgi:arylsulfatase A-like enzyme